MSQMNRLTCSFDPGVCESQERDAKNPVTSAVEARNIYGKWLGLTQLSASVRRSLCGHLVTRVTSHCDRALSLDGVVNVHPLLRFRERFCRPSHRANVLLIPPQGLLLRGMRMV
jgi:hypothetical protein